MREDYRELVHTLNQRCRFEFDRAERLAAELRHIRGSRLWRWCCRLRTFANLLRRRSTPPAASAATHNFRLCTPALAAHGRVSIVIPFRGQFGTLRNCLASLRRTAYRRFEVILVDNGSREPRLLRFLERLRQRRRYRIVRADEPFNFARLCNRGVREACGDYLLFLNNDVEALQPDWLEHLLRLAAAPEVGIVGGTLLYPDGTLQHAGIFPRSDGAWTHVYRGCPADHPGDHGELHLPRAVPAVTGACLLIGRGHFEELDGFDESYPLTMNDVDLCCRMRQRGLLTAISPQARLLHFESLSRGYNSKGASLPSRCV